VHDQQRLLENRLTRLVAEYVRPALYRATAPVELTWWEAPGEPVPFAEAVGQTYAPVAVGTRWGRPWGTTWIHVTGEVPAEWRDGGSLSADTSLELVVDLGFDHQPGFQAEALAWRPDGVTLKAVSPFNAHVPLDPAAPVDLYLEAAANPDIAQQQVVDGVPIFQPTPLGDLATAGDEPLYVLRRCELGLLDRQVWELLGEVRTLDGLMRELPESLPRRAEILQALPATSARSRCSAGPRTPAPTTSSPSGTRTSTRPGCGPSGRRSASAPGRSPTSSRWPTPTRTSGSPARRPSSTPG
jgi:alpha-mannosidase